MLRPRRLVVAAALVIALVATVLALSPTSRDALAERMSPGTEAVRRALEGRGRAVRVGAPGWGASFVAPSSVAATDAPEVAKALAGERPEALVQALTRIGADTLVVRPGPRAPDRPPGTVGERLAAAEHVVGLRGLILSPSAYVYAVDPRPALDRVVARALARVAREIVGGARAPRVSSFPAATREPGNVEVMVMLRDHGRARLWRSARGSSIARGLVTAALVARRRWTERERAMGGPIDDKLPWLDVEVSLLEEDGTIAARSPSFVESVFTPQHGVAYEQKGAWRYLLPEATRRDGQGSAVRAYEALFAEHGIPADSLTRRDLRLYRLVSDTIARSAAPLGDPLGASALD